MDSEEALGVGHQALPTEGGSCPGAQVLQNLLALAMQAVLLPPPPAREAVPATKTRYNKARCLQYRQGTSSRQRSYLA